MIRYSLAALLASTAGAAAQIVPDGSFETSGPAYPGGAWAQFSTNFGTPLCNGECFGDGGTSAAYTGQWWAWFGGADLAFEQGTVSQAVTIPSGGAVLHFFLQADSQRTDGTDYLRISLDNTIVFAVTDLDLAAYIAAYGFVTVDISPFSGGTHTLKFDGVTHGGGFITNFFVDDVYIVAGTAACYANCDSSTSPPILNANDFQCFLNKFAAQDPTANCDGSTAAPLLNANDFQCFLNAFAAGCS
jgi:hypothetical protein